MMNEFGIDDRAISSTVTHALTLGITTILIASLLAGAGTMLDSYDDQSTRSGLETVGERIAGEIADVDRVAGDDGTVNLTARHPDRVAGSAYTVEVPDDCDDPLLDDGQHCIRLSPSGSGPDVYVPVSNESTLDTDSSVRGGTFEISHDDSGVIRLR